MTSTNSLTQLNNICNIALIVFRHFNAEKLKIILFNPDFPLKVFLWFCSDRDCNDHYTPPVCR